MIAIIKREIASFFSSPVGYLVIGVFLLVNGLFLWVFDGPFNILYAGFADLASFFQLAPWILVFLIPAVSMRSFSEEKRSGTLELLLTKPISTSGLVLAKYFGILILLLISLLPTFLYLLSLESLKIDTDLLDYGSIFGSYLGLFFLMAAFASIGVLASSLTSNQIVAFLFGVIGCFGGYFGIQGLAESLGSGAGILSDLGMQWRYEDLGRGVIDLKHLLYFLAFILLFLTATEMALLRGRKRIQPKRFIKPVGLFIALVAVSFILPSKRFDLTADKRYSLNKATVELLEKAEAPVNVTVFLEGEFPSEFRKLQAETKQLLQGFKSVNRRVTFEFVNVLEDEENPEQVQQQLANMGILPARATVRQGGQTNQVLVYPWALANYQEKTVAVPLLKNQLGTAMEERVLNSIQNLEYAFADGFSKVIEPKKRKVAVLKGNGQLDDAYIADFFRSLRDYYFIAEFTLDSVATNPSGTLSKLNEFDLLVSAKPTQRFNTAEKYILDQYQMQGGKSLWLVDAITMETDSLQLTGEYLATPKDLNLTDFFFKYGVRINPNVVQDVYSAPLVLATGDGQESQYERYPWFYTPLTASGIEHPITTNIEAVKFQYASGIDTLDNGIDKTILLSSSPLSALRGVPNLIRLEEIESFLKTVGEGPDPTRYNAGEVPMAVLLEGAFTSVFKNRQKPYVYSGHKDEGVASKMVVVSDGDLIKNELQGNRPLELGYDRLTGNFYGNKEFLLNTVNYLLDDSGLINIRSKEIALAFLDQQKISRDATQWQALNILLPLTLLGLIGFGYRWSRRRKYAS
ncbi:gliding motility-associated ABC transporter substrate-binding protein GldG [Gilvibacter sp.]|uniref:gliding motility-associated ABC transporter substrate-binding protein GldG n=1 Tax=Gilvibacter sp. TaxID=2729997 RepID=UPI003F4A0B33